MKLSKEWLESDIIHLISDQVQENLELDYKACDALQKTDGKKKEISKDVSSFANSAGGVIIYGIVEKGHLPDSIDSGFDPNNISREWLEQVINSNIHPRIDNLHINQVELNNTSSGRVIYVVTIPQATTRAPHQAADHRYYKRHNFQSIPMEDYEIRDILRRANSPDLRLNFSVVGGNTVNLTFLPEQPISQEIELTISIENISEEPASYAVIDIYMDTSIKIIDAAGMQVTENLMVSIENISEKDTSFLALQLIPESKIPLNRFNLNWGIPSKLPKGDQRVRADKYPHKLPRRWSWPPPSGSPPSATSDGIKKGWLR